MTCGPCKAGVGYAVRMYGGVQQGFPKGCTQLGAPCGPSADDVGNDGGGADCTSLEMIMETRCP